MDIPGAAHSPIPNRFDLASHEILRFLRDSVPMGLWTVTRFVDGQQVYLWVEDTHWGVPSGVSVPWASALCSHMVTGKPHIARDVREIAEYHAITEADGGRVAAYIGYPLVTSTGELFGTLCGFAPEPLPPGVEDDGPLIELLSRLLATILDSDLERTALRREVERANIRALKDGLTGLLNRAGWESILANEEERYRRFGDSCTVLCIDLDDLKAINDTFGHSAGDDLIRLAAQVLLESVSSGDLVARVGGDEFGVISPNTGTENGARLADRLATALSAAGVSASIGQAQCTVMDGLGYAWKEADAAMYRCKNERRSP